ncbi:ABC transporter ATP-binding protein [Camelimonas fluminis]|uniref:Urea ABC transporter ATP-binding subunit UrtE n=1 Tax=Camelimonas fluminis TaxID=1576911 RepID=A0ABV7UDY8_9HYPH|nr:urea ABC transporter ATP-binding subunit UrtE [Camelimonas fluminis]GHE51813.1 ABC transporter ATP-binding protein [Camelimonas fluminis]
MLKIANLRSGYGASEVLHGLDLELAPGEIVAVMGRNGMGKSTLMKTLMGIIPAMDGDMRVADAPLNGLKPHRRVAAGVAYVPQGRMIFSALTVQENIETGLTVTGRRDVPQDLYSMFPVLWEMRGRRGGNLSGGQQQQLAIARALASNPQTLLLDEPTEGIQPSIIKDMARTLKQLRDARGLSILVSEQVLSFALDVADRIVVIDNGRFVHEAQRADVDAAAVERFLSV